MKINCVYDYDGVTDIPNSIDFEPFIKHWNTDFRPQDHETTEFFKEKNYRLISSFNTSLNPVTLNRIDTHQFFSYKSELNLDSKDDVYLYMIRVRELFEFSFNLNHQYNDNKSVIDTISKRIKNLITPTNNLYIYIEYTWEGQFDFSFFHKIYYDLRLNKIPANKVIFVSNTQNIVELHNIFLNNFYKNKKVKFTHYNQCLFGKAIDTRSKNNTFLDKSYLEKNQKRNKKALILNRRLRFHRLVILSALAADNLLDYTLSSFDMNLEFELDFLKNLYELKKDNKFITNEYFYKKVKEGYVILNHINKRFLDYENLNDVIGLGYETKEIYENTYFSIVTETLFDEAEKFVSEKTYKPILHYHPFVLVGSAGTLKYLKSYGFKTFDKWWDESYDGIENTNDRFLKVYEVINNLINKSDDEWITMYNEMKPILIHNRNILLSFINDNKLGNIVKNNLIKIISNEDYKKDIKLF